MSLSHASVLMMYAYLLDFVGILHAKFHKLPVRCVAPVGRKSLKIAAILRLLIALSGLNATAGASRYTEGKMYVGNFYQYARRCTHSKISTDPSVSNLSMLK